MNNPLLVFDWDYIVSTNEVLCKKSGYQHGITSEGYEPTKEMFRNAADLTKNENESNRHP